MPRHGGVGGIEHNCAIELSYGMRVEREGSHFLCRWDPECLRRFVAEHVLLHEIGHQIQHRQRLLLELRPSPGDRVSEQFADHYALRMVRQRRYGLKYSR